MKPTKTFKADGRYNYRFNPAPFRKAYKEVLKGAPLGANGKLLHREIDLLRELSAKIGLKNKGIKPAKHLLNGEPVRHTTAAIAHAWQPGNPYEKVSKPNNGSPPQKTALDQIRQRGFVRYGIVPFPGAIGRGDTFEHPGFENDELVYKLQSAFRKEGISKLVPVVLSNREAQEGLRSDLDFVIGGTPLEGSIHPKRAHPLFEIDMGLLVPVSLPDSEPIKIGYVVGTVEELAIKNTNSPKTMFEGYSSMERGDQYTPLFNQVKAGHYTAALAPTAWIASWMLAQMALNVDGRVLTDKLTPLDFLDGRRFISWIDKYLPDWSLLATMQSYLRMQINQRSGIHNTEKLSECLNEVRRDGGFMNRILMRSQTLVEGIHATPELIISCPFSKPITDLRIELKRIKDSPTKLLAMMSDISVSHWKPKALECMDKFLKEIWIIDRTQPGTVRICTASEESPEWDNDHLTCVLMRYLERGCPPDEGQMGFAFTGARYVNNDCSLQPMRSLLGHQRLTAREFLNFKLGTR